MYQVRRKEEVVMRKNVVLIMTDDQGAWTLGCAGCPEAHTPNIDQLAASGARFENYFCVSPVCSPARASIFTVNIPSAQGVTDWLDNGDIDASKYEVTRMPMYASEKEEIRYLDGQMTYTDVLAENGYTCALAGKWHLGDSVSPQQGFSKWFSVPLGHISMGRTAGEERRFVTIRPSGFRTWKPSGI